MNLDKTIKELSQNEKKVLLTLEKLNGSASPDDVLKLAILHNLWKL